MVSFAKIDRHDIAEIQIIVTPKTLAHLSPQARFEEHDLVPLESGACSVCHVEIESNVKYDMRCPLCSGKVWLT